MKIGTDGQVTIPAAIRDYLCLRPGEEVEFCPRDGEVVLRKAAPAEAARARAKFETLVGIWSDGPSTDEWMAATRGD